MNIILDTFETTQCVVYVIDTQLEQYNEKIYCLVSVHNNDLSQNVRFGNKKQINSMINSYKKTGIFEL